MIAWFTINGSASNSASQKKSYCVEEVTTEQ